MSWLASLVSYVVVLATLYFTILRDTTVSWSSASIGELHLSNHWYNFRHDAAPLWCGKAYQPEWPAVDPGGRMSLPDKGKARVLDVRTYSRMNTYFHGEKVAEIIVELDSSDRIYKRHEHDQELIYVDDHVNGPIKVLLNHTLTQSFEDGLELPYKVNFSISLNDLETRERGHEYVSLVQVNSKNIIRTGEVCHLPPRTHAAGSFSKLDRVTGLVMVNSTTTGKALSAWTPVVPYGFYNAPADLSMMAQQGFNVLHIVPGLPTDPNYGYGKDYRSIIDEAAELGIWVMHDTRWSWQKDDDLARQLELLKDAPNLLTWYVGDEPDGNTDDPATFQRAIRQIRSIDARYHVLSSAFNCESFMFKEYTRDIDVIMPDPYPVAMYSSTRRESIFGTTCNTTYGCCGCDNCIGSIRDVSNRIDAYHDHLTILDRHAAVWIVPQGFGSESHWTRFPSELESMAKHVIALNHGVTGAVSWIYNDKHIEFPPVLQATQLMAEIVNRYNSLLFTSGERSNVVQASVDVAMWQNASFISIMAVSLDDSSEDHEIVLPVSHARLHETSHLYGSSLLRVGSGQVVLSTSTGLSVDIWILHSTATADA